MALHNLSQQSDSFQPTDFNPRCNGLCIPTESAPARPVLVLLEGRNDVEFLMRIARVLRREQVISIDLDTLLAAKRLIFLPLGGGLLGDWWDRFAPLGCREFHLFDREIQPQTAERQLVVKRVNSRPHCRAQLTSKRSLENYLHPAAIEAAGGGRIQFGDFECVADVLVRSSFGDVPGSTSWSQLSRRTQQRLIYRAKRWLNSDVVERMTPQWLSERDPQGEVHNWLSTITELAQ